MESAAKIRIQAQDAYSVEHEVNGNIWEPIFIDARCFSCFLWGMLVNVITGDLDP